MSCRRPRRRDGCCREQTAAPVASALVEVRVKRAAQCWLIERKRQLFCSFALFLAFQTIISPTLNNNITPHILAANALQQQQPQAASNIIDINNNNNHQASNHVGASLQEQQQQQHAAAAAQAAAAAMSDGGAISALDSSAALVADDLIAAESSLGPDSSAVSSAPAEHKTFTNAQVVRQDNSPVAVTPSQMQFQVNPQQQQQQQAQLQPQQQPPQATMFNTMHLQQQQQQRPPHQMAIQSRIAPHSPNKQPQGNGPFNPFMAALAGNYGPAQQQIAAAAAAGLQHAQHPQQQHGPVHPHGHFGPQQMHHAPQHQQQMMNPQQQQQQMMPHPQQQVSGHNQQLVRQQVAAAVQPQPAEQVAALAVQESSLRSNIVPAPGSFQAAAAVANQAIDSNTIELNSNQQDPNQQQQVQQQQVVQAAASVQHPVIAAANGGPIGSSSGAGSSQMQESASSSQAWPLQAPEIPKIVNLEVKCEKNLMKVSIEFDKIFNGVIFSKGHYNQNQCVHVNQNSGRQQAYFDISINSCGTQGNTQNGLYGMGGNTGSGTYFENTIVVQYDPNVQEVYDHARKLRCTWHDQYEKAVTFRPFPVDMLDIVRADFAGDNVGCWMQIQVGKGPWASEVAGIVKIGQTMTMVLAIKDEENKFDMLVRNCFAHDGKRGPIELVDKSGCITRPKLMSRFTKIKNFGSSATVLSYAHFQAFKFPDSMEVHFQCTIQICRHQCPDQCSSSSGNPMLAGANSAGGMNGGGAGETYSESTISGTMNLNGAASSNHVGQVESTHLRKYGGNGGAGLSRERRDLSGSHHHHHHWHNSSSSRQHPFKPATQTVGLNRVIQVVSTGDLAFAFNQAALRGDQLINGTTTGDRESAALESSSAEQQIAAARVVDLSQQICMSSFNFVLSVVILVLILLCSTLVAVSLYLRQRNYAKRSNHSSSKLLMPASNTTTTTGQLHKSSPHHLITNQQYNNNHHHHTNKHQLASPGSTSCTSSSSSSLNNNNNVPQQQLYSTHHRSNHHHY